ncbi:hypothetical protein ACLK2I_01135 [Escherichia coli]
MRTSQYLLSTLKETPADAEVISHQRTPRAGMTASWPPGYIPGCRPACAF